MFDKIVEVISSLLGTSGHWLIASVMVVIISSLYIWKRNFLLTLLFLSSFCLLIASLLLPVFSPNTERIKFCINEFTQTFIADKFGIEKLYSQAIKSLETKENIKFPAYSSQVINDDYFELIIPYARNPALLSCTILVSPKNHKILYSEQSLYNKILWKNNYAFIAPIETIQYALTQKYLIKLVLFEFWLWLFIFIIGYKYAYNKMYCIEKKLFVILMSLIPIIWICWEILLTPGIYINSYKSTICNLKNNHEILYSKIKKTSVTGTSILSLDNKEYKIFISKDNFLPTNFLRIDLDLFNYIYFAENENDIIHSPEITLRPINEKLFIGTYENYIKKSNYTTLTIFSILTLQLILIVYFYGVKYIKMKILSVNVKSHNNE